jgi:hypothetical protein
MKRFQSMALTAIALTTTLTAYYYPDLARDINCEGTLGAISVGNVKVPFGKTCTLNATRVQGSITIEPNATLHANRVRVVGNIQAESASAVKVSSGSAIVGGIQIKQGKQAKITGSRIDGYLQFEANNRNLSVENNRIGGNRQAPNTQGELAIAGGRIKGILQCKANHSALYGGGNISRGSTESQCAKL